MKKRKILLDYFLKIGYGQMFLGEMANVFVDAKKDGAEELYVTKNEWELVKKWFACNGSWNWDMKTFWGMMFIIEE